MAPRSESLFHFMPREEFLLATLKHGFWPRYSLEDIRWQQNDIGMDFVAYPMACFCDIPLSRISEHVKFYGSFGLGMTRDWGKRKLLNPLLYLAGQNKCRGSLTAMAVLLEKYEEGRRDEAWAAVLHFASYVKPVEGSMKDVTGKYENKDFVQESEWRFVPQGGRVIPFLREEDFETEEKREEANRITGEDARLKFEAKDVQYIFVPADRSIPRILQFIHSELTQFSEADRLLLISRVISLETVGRDF